LPLLVERWDGKEDKEREDAEESSKRRRDIWDEEYDTGKVGHLPGYNKLIVFISSLFSNLPVSHDRANTWL
jgi:hypothetical protein